MPDADDGNDPIPVQSLPDEPVPIDPLAADEPWPVEAIPVEAPPPPVPPPMAAWPRADLPTLPSGPPRAVMTLGVCGIVFASVALLGGGVTTLGNWITYNVSAMQVGRANAQAQQQTAATAAVESGPPEVVGPDGMDAAARQAVAEGLNRSRPLSVGQLAQLDELLAEDGKTIVHTGGPVDADVVFVGVSASGQVGTLGPAAAALGESAPARPSYYLLATGRLTVGETEAVFSPTDGQPPTPAAAFPLPPVPADAAAPPPLSDDAIRSVLRAVTRFNGARPKSAQVRAVVDLLRTGTQQVVVPTDNNVDPAAEVTGARTDEDGTLQVTTHHGTSDGTLSVTADGRVSADLSAGNAVRYQPPSAMALRGAMFASVAQFGLAALLLVAGILTVRQHRRGAQLHWAYVGLKLVVGTLAIVAAQRLWWSLPTLPNSTATTAVSPWAWPAAVGLVYPVVLVFVLLSAPVRTYYRAVR